MTEYTIVQDALPLLCDAPRGCVIAIVGRRRAGKSELAPFLWHHMQTRLAELDATHQPLWQYGLFVAFDSTIYNAHHILGDTNVVQHEASG
jgi:ABC-type polysaccharide/polyol phosphate transport system ATPase subunit